MRFGICAPLEAASAVREAGWDFVEENVQALLQGTLPDDQWTGMDRAKATSLPVPAANCLVPADLKITGPDADSHALRAYMQCVVRRAAEVNISTLVFGSGGARNVPDGFGRDQARNQIITFAKMAAPIAKQNDITLVVEHLNKGECNIINSLTEAMTYVRAVAHPNFQCLLDSYHFWLENETLVSLRESIRAIRHVHLADTEGRVAPGESGKSDYKPIFRILKELNYRGLISVESPPFSEAAIRATGARVLEFIKRQWAEA